MHALIFGAGNIGRSFIGQLFATAGYAVTFVDVNEALVAELNRQGRYRLEVRGPEPRDIWVEGVSAIDGRDRDRVAERAWPRRTSRRPRLGRGRCGMSSRCWRRGWCGGARRGAGRSIS